MGFWDWERDLVHISCIVVKYSAILRRAQEAAYLMDAIVSGCIRTYSTPLCCFLRPALGRAPPLDVSMSL